MIRNDSITFRLSKEEKRNFVNEVECRCMNTTTLLRLFAKKFTDKTEETIDFLVNERK